jgi:hypothetical protein
MADTTETTPVIDPDYDPALIPSLKPDRIERVSPYAVVLGANESGQDRAKDVRHDAAFLSSIATFGVQEVVGVQPEGVNGDKHYRVVKGNRRTAAVRHLIATGALDPEDPKARLPIRIVVGDAEDLNLLENFMSLYPNPMDKAEALHRLTDKGMSVADIGKRIRGSGGKPLGKTAIDEYLALLQLHPRLQSVIRKDLMTFTVAREIVRGKKTHEEQVIIAEGLLASGKPITKDDAKAALKAHKSKKGIDGEPMYGSPVSMGSLRRLLDELHADAKGVGTDGKEIKGFPNAESNGAKGDNLACLAFSLMVWLNGGMVPKKAKSWEEKTRQIKDRLRGIL